MLQSLHTRAPGFPAPLNKFQIPGEVIPTMVESGASYATILVVEDHGDSRHMIKRALEMGGEGRVVVEAVNGQEAVDMVRRACPNLVLMDLNMPEMDGLTAAKLIRECRERCMDVPIVAMTAYPVYGIREAALEAGCNDFLVKPLDFEELERVLRQFVPGW